MSTTSIKSKRIAKNTLLLYFRMLFLMIVSLYTSRVILDALGVIDYGIYNIVGGFVGMFGIVSAALTSACSRFLNFEMGRGDFQRQQIVFSTAVSIQWGLAIIIAIMAEAIGIWYVNNVMVLPPERLVAANWCFQFSVLNFCLGIITVPYNASIIAHEQMSTFAYVSIYEGLAKLAVAFMVYWDAFDHLILYAVLLSFIQLTVCIVYQIYCRHHFKECIYRKYFDKPLLKQMFSYSLWHLIGNGAAILKVHGVSLVLNLVFGPAINAARGIASQVENAINQFANNFMIAMNPQITQSYASRDLKYMFHLVYRGACYSYYMLLMLSLPIIINADYILRLWLKEVPEYTVIFVQLTLISMMISSISKPLMTAQNATGNVRTYQLVIGLINLMNLPLCYIFLKLGYPPESVVIIAIVVEIIAFFARIFLIPQTIQEFRPIEFLSTVGFRCVAVTLPPTIIMFIIHHYTPETFWTFCVNVIICFVLSAITILHVGCTQNERKIVIDRIRRVVFKAYRHEAS